MANDFQMLTKKGYDFFEVSSSFQKSIRRCMEEESLYWAIELWNSNYKEYVWKRMLIIASEDVGLAEPQMAGQIFSLYQIYTQLAKKKDKHSPEKLHFTQAVVMLARCKKSRYIDMILCEKFMNHDKNHLEVPEFAYDMHTRKGRKMGRGGRKGIVHFYESSALINNNGNVQGEAELLDRVMLTEMDEFKPKVPKNLFDEDGN